MYKRSLINKSLQFFNFWKDDLFDNGSVYFVKHSFTEHWNWLNIKSFHILSWIWNWENGSIVFQNSLALLICLIGSKANKNWPASVTFAGRYFRVDSNIFYKIWCLKETNGAWQIFFLFTFSSSAIFHLHYIF